MRIRVRTNPDAYMKKRVAQPKDFLRVSPGFSRAFPAFRYPKRRAVSAQLGADDGVGDA
jgi:hypothetical protein